MKFWNATEDRRPIDDREVLTISPGGMEQTMRYRKGLWWISDDMYAHYSPLMWRPIEEGVSE